MRKIIVARYIFTQAPLPPPLPSPPRVVEYCMRMGWILESPDNIISAPVVECYKSVPTYIMAGRVLYGKYSARRTITGTIPFEDASRVELRCHYQKGKALFLRPPPGFASPVPPFHPFSGEEAISGFPVPLSASPIVSLGSSLRIKSSAFPHPSNLIFLVRLPSGDIFPLSPSVPGSLASRPFRTSRA